MAIDDNTNYTLTGAQVKDLAQRIKSGGGGGNAVILYSSVSFHTPLQLVDIYSDAALTTTVTGTTVKGYIEAGKTVAIIYETSVSDVPQNETLIITSCDNHSEATHGVIVFTGTFFDYANSEPVLYTLACDQPSNLWSASQKSIPTKTSDITNDGSDGTSTYVEADDLATVATSGSYNDLIDLPSDRLYRMLVPTGTEITSNKNLNTTEFLVVGRYYCSANNTVATLSNCPTTSAFMMDVFSPLSITIDNETTSPWCYRLRLLTTYQGEMWVQTVDSGATAGVFTYHAWRRYDVPGVKNATAVTHTDYNNNQDYIPNMRFLSFWNGAYNSSGNSNISKLANGCIKSDHLSGFSTANTSDTWVPVASNGNLQHRVIKAFNSDGSIPKSAMHGIPAPDPSSVITNWGSITASGNNEKTMSADGFVVGKGCTFGGDQTALVKLNGQEVGGVSYTTFSGYMQVGYCFPVRSGDKVQFYLNKSGPQHQGCKLIGWKM